MIASTKIKVSPPVEPFEDRNVASAVCRSTPNGLNNLNSQIDQCTSTAELNRNKNFAENTFKIQKDIEHLSASVGDSLVLGDSMFGNFGSGDIAKQVTARNMELKAKKETLMNEVDKNEAVIERSNRDFSDVKDTLPETQPKKFVRFIEDYTLAILAMSYLFMIIVAIYVYTIMAERKLIAFGQSLLGSILLTCFMSMVLLYLS